MKKSLKFILPFVVLIVAAIGAAALIKMRPRPQTRVPEIRPPLVRVQPVRGEDLRMTVHSQGTVVPRTESALVPEISGRVVTVSPSLVAGGFFETGDVLLTIDPRDYELAVIRARADVARAEKQLRQEEAESEVARREWGELGRGEASPLTLRLPQMEEARAALASAGAALERAELDLERTGVRAPFAGRVRDKTVDVGQFVVRGNPVATLYAVDYAEVRLPIPDDQLRFVDLPLDYRGEAATGRGPKVTLRAAFGGRQHEWQGRIVRTEGEIDPRSRVVYAVARVEDPYARGDDPDRPPLAVGLFVEADIAGRLYENVVALPRTALRDNGRVLVVDPDERLRFRQVEVLRAERDRVVILSGLESGERVCVTALDAVVDGMRVRTRSGRPAVPDESATGAPS
jgi:RND family efflux transporter MFP subunit